MSWCCSHLLLLLAKIDLSQQPVPTHLKSSLLSPSKDAWVMTKAINVSDACVSKAAHNSENVVDAVAKLLRGFTSHSLGQSFRCVHISQAWQRPRPQAPDCVGWTSAFRACNVHIVRCKAANILVRPVRASDTFSPSISNAKTNNAESRIPAAKSPIARIPTKRQQPQSSCSLMQSSVALGQNCGSWNDRLSHVVLLALPVQCFRHLSVSKPNNFWVFIHGLPFCNNQSWGRQGISKYCAG